MYEGNHDAILVKDANRLFTWGVLQNYADVWVDAKVTFFHHV